MIYICIASFSEYIVAIDYYNVGEYIGVKFTLWDVGELITRKLTKNKRGSRSKSIVLLIYTIFWEEGWHLQNMMHDSMYSFINLDP